MPFAWGMPPIPAGCSITRLLSVMANCHSRKKSSRGTVDSQLGLARPAFRNADRGIRGQETIGEVGDRELLAVPIEGVDVYVTSKEVDGRTPCRAGETSSGSWRVPAQDHSGSDRRQHPDFAKHAVAARRHRHPRRTHAGCRSRDQAVGLSGSCDGRGRCRVYRRGHRAWPGGLQGRQCAAHAVDLRRCIDLRSFFGWLRSVWPTFGRITSSTLRFMNSVGLCSSRWSASRPGRVSSPACSSLALACSSGASR